MKNHQDKPHRKPLPPPSRKGQRIRPVLLKSNESLSNGRRPPPRAINVEDYSHCYTVPQQHWSSGSQ